MEKQKQKPDGTYLTFSHIWHPIFSLVKGKKPKIISIQFVSFFFLKGIFFFYLFLAVLGLHFCARAFSSCGKQGPLFIAVRGPLAIAASLVAEHRLQTRRLSSCGSRAQLLRGMWDPPRARLEPESPALAGGFSTTAPPGKPSLWVFDKQPHVPHTLPGLSKWSTFGNRSGHILCVLSLKMEWVSLKYDFQVLKSLCMNALHSKARGLLRERLLAQRLGTLMCPSCYGSIFFYEIGRASCRERV